MAKLKAEVITEVTEFISRFSKLSHKEQIYIIGVLKGMVATNEFDTLQKEGE